MHAAPKRLHETLLPPVGSRVQLVGAGRYRAARGHDYPAHYHPTLELIVYEEGSIACLLDGHEAVETRPGTVLVIVYGCKTCQGERLEVRWGRHNYYFKCLDCGGNTAIKRRCGGCSREERVRKQGLEFYGECGPCGRSALFFTNQ